MIPTHNLTGTPCNVQGPFDGNADNTNVSLNGQAVFILAESKSQSIFFYPANATGNNTLSVQETGKPECSGTVSGVQLIVTAGKLNLQRGDKTNINVRATGLENLTGIATLRLNNLTSTVVTLLPSNTIVIPLPPDSVSTGTFNRSFEVQSIRTGTFSIDVNLDLPERPGTEPQPNQPTQPQCPGCTCSCTATIIHVEDKEGVSTYRVSVTSSCTGQYGPPPCKDCGIVDPYEYEWQVAFSAGDGIESVGPNTGSGFSFKNPKKAPFSLYVTVSVICNKGAKCICTAKFSSGPPTVPEEKCPGCQCECGVKIVPLDKQGDFWPYFASVNAVCTGKFGEKPPCEPCTVKKYEYEWTMPKGEDKVAKIEGARNGWAVVVRPIKKGKFTLHVMVTVSCSDGKTCKCEAVFEDEVLDDGCILTWKEIAEPKMTGELDPVSLGTKTIKRDEFIALKATGKDIDHIVFYCTSVDCKDKSSAKYQQLSGKVRFEWKIDEGAVPGKGSFVKLGCLPENLQDATGDQVIFKPPALPLPKDKEKADTTIWTDIILSIIDDNPTQPEDRKVKRDLTIKIKRDTTNPDFYEVTITQDKEEEEEKTSFGPLDGNCNVNIEKFIDATGFDEVVIKLPEGGGIVNNTQLLPGEWILLEANEQNETDRLKAFCTTKNACKLIRNFDKNYVDGVEWEWSVGPGDGSFAGSGETKDYGRFVIYEAPKTVTKYREITITVKVYNKSPKYTDATKSGTITIKVYPAGIKLMYPPPTWVPDTAVPATLTSYLVYKDNAGVWQPAFEHNCRIHFFELMDVSNQPGICMNAPKVELANKCPDLRIKEQAGLELIPPKEAIKDCKETGYFMKGRTEKPMLKYEIKISAEDYGAFGFLVSMANTYKIEKETKKEKKKTTEILKAVITGDPPFYESVSVKKEDVVDPLKKTQVEKRIVYEDNRVNIPKDIDENHIPDEGWIITLGGGRYPDANEPMDSDVDDEPVGDGFPGDGLSLYEEYRGFMVKSSHHRTYPKMKDLFVSNMDGLPIDEFVKITKIPVHEITESQYGPMDKDYFMKKKPVNYTKNNQRFVNFNFDIGHVTDQKGLYLFNATIDEVKLKIKELDMVLGWTPSEKESVTSSATPAPPNWNEYVQVDKKEIKRICDEDPKDALDEATKLPQVVAHELCHALNVYHHGSGAAGLTSGDKECVMRYDNYKRRDEKPGNSLCPNKNGATGKEGGSCAKQLRICGRLVVGAHGFPTRKL